MSNLESRIAALEKEIQTLRNRSKVKVMPCQLYFGRHVWDSATTHERILLLMGGKVYIFDEDGIWFNTGSVGDNDIYLGEEVIVDSLTYVFDKELKTDGQ